MPFKPSSQRREPACTTVRWGSATWPAPDYGASRSQDLLAALDVLVHEALGSGLIALGDGQRDEPVRVFALLANNRVPGRMRLALLEEFVDGGDHLGDH